MRSHIVKSIFKKEMIDILRDKKTLFMTIILPLVMYPVLILVLSQLMMTSMNNMAQKELPIAFNTPPSVRLLERLTEVKEGEGKLKVIEVKDYEQALAAREIVAYIEIEEQESAVNYKIYMNSSVEDAQEAKGRLENTLIDYKQELIEQNVESLGLDKAEILEPITYETINVAKAEEKAGYLLGTMLPLLLMMGILLGAVYPAIDVMAGEKERGTLETLLTLPISNLELVIGKYLAVSLSAIMTALFNILSIILSGIFIAFNMSLATELGMGDMNISGLILPGIITLVCVCIFAMVVAAISMCVCSMAKNFKEAQNYITPVMFLVLIPAYVTMIPSIEFNLVTASIPVVNVAMLIKSVLIFRYDASLMAIVLISNIIFVMLSVLLLSKMFKSEDILFGEGKSFSFLEKRSNIKKGTLPTISDGIILYSIGMLAVIYLGTVLQVKFKMAGIAGTQLIILALPLLLAVYIKADFKKVFSIKIPKPKHLLGAISLWAGGYIVVLLVANTLLYLFPQNMEVAEALTNTLFNKNSLLINLCVVAVMPAICEEIFYRGFIFTAFKGKDAYKPAILLSGLLFGMMHMDFIRIVPTAILGIIFAYAVYKSSAIFVSMLMHFLNNAMAILLMHKPEGKLAELIKYTEINFEQFNMVQLILLIVVSITLIGLGVLLLNLDNSKNDKNIIKNC